MPSLARTNADILITGDNNRIINGNFDIWQRGTSTTTTLTYVADRWLPSMSGGTVTHSRGSFAVGDTLGSQTATFYYRIATTGQTGLATDQAVVSQRIEGVDSYAGQTVTVLGWVRRAVGATGNIGVQFAQFFGGGGSPSASVSGTGVAVPVSGSTWQPFAAVLDIPSISGKVLGTNGNDYLTINLWTSAGSNFATNAGSIGVNNATFDFYGIHIRPGNHPASAAYFYQQNPPSIELLKCQRFYHRITGPGTTRVGVGHVNATTSAAIIYMFPTTMRAAPFTFETSGTATDYDVQHNNTATTCSVVPASLSVNPHVAVMTFTVASGLTLGQGCNGRIATANGYIGFGAEL